MNHVVDSAHALPADFSLSALPDRAEPGRFLMVSAEEFDVVDVRNPFMKSQLGKVNSSVAQSEWEELRQILDKESPGGVAVLPPIEGSVDMVFAQNQVLLGRDSSGTRICVRSRMRVEARRREVPPMEAYFLGAGYERRNVVPKDLCFEGGGDATWHPGRALLWGGYGPRSDKEVYPAIAEAFSVPVLRLALVDPRFYHLDTCFRPLDENTVLIYPGAFTPEGQELIARVFPSVVPVSESEAEENLALNGVVLQGRKMVLHKGSSDLCAMLRALGWSVREVRLGEFLRSGGSAYCMVQAFEPED